MEDTGLKGNIVLHPDSIPKIPLFPCIALYLLLKDLNAAGWVWGAVGFFMAVTFVASLYKIWHAKFVKLEDLV